MRTTKLATIVVALLVSVASVFAQTCSELLHQGIYNIHSTDLNFEKTMSYANWFCDQNFQSASQAENYGASLAFPIKAIPVQFGFNASKQSWSQWYRSFCQDVKVNQNTKIKLREHVRTIDSNILAAFNQCLSAKGLHVWLEKSYDPALFTFTARFNSPTADPSATITAFQMSQNVSCGIQAPIEVTGAGLNVLCKRLNKAALLIVVNADWEVIGGNQLTLPPIADPPPVVERPCEEATIKSESDKYFSSGNTVRIMLATIYRSSTCYARLSFRTAAMFGHQYFPNKESAPWANVTLLDSRGSIIATGNGGLASVGACAGYQDHVYSLAKVFSHGELKRAARFRINMGGTNPQRC